MVLTPEGVAHFVEGEGLELADTLPRDPEFPTDFFQSHRLHSVEAEAGIDDTGLPFVEHTQKAIEFIVKILAGECVVGTHGVLVSDHFTKGRLLAIMHGCIERGWALGGAAQESKFLARDSCFIGELLVGGFATQGF